MYMYVTDCYDDLIQKERSRDSITQCLDTGEYMAIVHVRNSNQQLATSTGMLPASHKIGAVISTATLPFDCSGSHLT